MKFKVAVVQLKVNFSDVESTFKKLEKYLKEASKKADIIVFPEYLIPWHFEDEGKLKRRFQELAKRYKIDIVTGSMLDRYKEKKYNTTYYVDSGGKVRGTYRKVNLWHTERFDVAFGNEISVFNTRFGKVGIVICWDLAFPEIYRMMVKKGVRIVICPAFWSYQDASPKGLKHNKKAEEIFIDSCCVSRAYENEIIHVFCNAAGNVKQKNSNLTLVGHSQIAIPFKGAVKKLNHNREEMFIQEVDTSILKDAEKAYGIRSDLKKRIL